ncbi:MAG: S-layer homology domain-containing protein [Firmicutes bacterium]|nr:S-layer homology domain-containing protein [Bacillota bacterium]
MKRKLISFLITIVLIMGILPLTVTAAEAPFTLEAPTNLTAELKKDSDGVPYFELRLNVPQSVRDLNARLLEDSEYFEGKVCEEIQLVFDYKYGKYDWNEGPSQYWNTSAYLADFLEMGYFEYYPFDSSTKYEDVDIKSEVYSFRARFQAIWGYVGDWLDNQIYSDYSNTVTIGNPAYWSTASDWATPELQKAAEAGLIPEILKNADMTKPITREEFAEVALLMYQKATGITDIPPASPNPFTDTKNPQILKAYQLGIVKGTSATTFDPKKLINREQVAAMLVRTIKLIAPNADYSTAGAPTFTDQADISGWALDDCLYIAKLGIIKGSNGKFMPRAVTQAQTAAGYANTSREQALAMSVRTVDKINEITESSH